MPSHFSVFGMMVCGVPGWHIRGHLVPRTHVPTCMSSMGAIAISAQATTQRSITVAMAFFPIVV